MNREYHFEDYNPEWITQFNEIKDFILSVLKEKVISIEHVGSTSISGMRAKPIIDILVVINPFIITEDEEAIFQKNDYYFSKNKVADNSAIFEKGVGSSKTENIHILPIDHFLIDQMVLSRDYLRNHPDRVMEYSKLKDALKEKYPNDYKLYREGKETFMEETAKLAYEAYKR